MAIRKTRNVSLTPELEAFLDGRVASGRYRSASEVVRAALRLLEDDERRRAGAEGVGTAPFRFAAAAAAPDGG
jgi:antitoxin ParD1/3/4